LDDKKFIDSLKSHWQNNDSALLFIFSLLKYRFLFDTYIIKREFTKDYKEEGKWSLQKLEKYEYQKGKYTLHKPEYKSTFSNDQLQAYNQQIKTLQSIFRITYTSPKTMHWISKLLIELNNDQNVYLVQILEKYACMKIHFSNYKTSSGFGIDRIIFTYLDYILYRDKLTETVNYEFQFRTSIEHFYPQNPIDSAKDWKIDKNNILNSFGNLALITVSANSKFSNLSPKSKVDSYPAIINQSPKLKLMAKYETWDEKSVKKHEEEMLKILENEIIKHELA